MKVEKRILIIDDRSQDAPIRELKQKVKPEFELVCEEIVTKRHALRKANSNDLDFEKLKAKINEVFDRYRWFDLILTDFDLEDPGNIDGLDVVDYIRSCRKKTKIIMYSANLSKVVKKVVHSDEGTLSEQQIVEAIIKLIDYQINDYVDRISYVEKTISFLKKNKEFSTQDEFLKLLYEHKDMTFNSCFPDFAGKKFGEIADIIDKKADARSNDWLLALIKQTMAYLTKVNE